jgi:A/G-specific adenine glycosylase
VFWTEQADGSVLVRRRPESGLLGGMAEFPSTDWREKPWTDAEARLAAPTAVRWQRLPGVVEHGFTHFRLELTVWRGRVGDAATATAGEDARWCRVEALGGLALPTLMRKVARHAMDCSGGTIG